MKTQALILAILALGSAAVRAEQAPALPDLPQSAVSFGAAVADGWVYVYGGNTGNAHEFHKDCIKGDLFRLKLAGGTEWEKLASAEPSLSAALVSHGGLLYRIGGMEARNAKGEKNNLHSTSHFQCYDPAKGEWKALAPLPKARSSHDAVVFEGVLYVGGGWTLAGGRDGTWAKTGFKYDFAAPEKGWQEFDQPFKRRALAMAVHQGKIWFLGGFDSLNTPARETDWLDPKTNTWGRGPLLPDSPMAGFGMAALGLDSDLIASPMGKKVFVLSKAGDAWNEAAELKSARFFHRIVPNGGRKFVAVGGSNQAGHIRTTEAIDLAAAAKADN